MPRPIHARVPEAARTPIRAIVLVSALDRPRAGTLSRRPRPAPRVLGRATRGQVRVVPTSAGPLSVAGVSVARVSVVLVPVLPQAAVPAPADLEAAAPVAEGPEPEGPDTEGPAAGPAGTATRAVKPIGTARRARAGRLEQRATTCPARVSRFGPAADAGSRQGARKKPAAGPAAQRSRAGGR